MKRITTLTLAAIISLLLTSCATTSSNNGGTPQHLGNDSYADCYSAHSNLLANADAKNINEVLNLISDTCRKEYEKRQTINARYSDNGDGTITDTQTGLVWKRCIVGQTWIDGTCVGEGTSFNWHQATKLTEVGWRLPKIDELRTLVYCSNTRQFGMLRNEDTCGNGETYYRPTIDIKAFPKTSTEWFWSSSPNTKYTDSSKWSVIFYNGFVGSMNISQDGHVRLVRDYNSCEKMVEKNIKADFNHVLEQCIKEAKWGHSEAQVILGKVFSDGEYVEQDFLESAKWYRLATEQGHVRAPLLLAIIFAMGQGTEVNQVKAYMLATISANYREQDANFIINLLAADMTPSQISEAQRLAKECLSNNFKECL